MFFFFSFRCILGIESDQSRDHPEYCPRHRWPSGSAGAVLRARRPLFADVALLRRQSQRRIEELSEHDGRKLRLPVNGSTGQRKHGAHLQQHSLRFFLLSVAAAAAASKILNLYRKMNPVKQNLFFFLFNSLVFSFNKTNKKY